MQAFRVEVQNTTKGNRNRPSWCNCYFVLTYSVIDRRNEKLKGSFKYTKTYM